MSGNLFAGLQVEDSDGEEGTLVIPKKETTPSSQPAKADSKPKSRGPSKQDSRSKSSNHNNVVGTDDGFEGDSRGRGRGNRNNNRGRGGRGGREKDHRSKGRGGTKPEEKKSGHGANNWGTKEDQVASAATGGDDATGEDATGGDDAAVADEEPESTEMTLEEYMKAKEASRSNMPSKKAERKAGEEDGGSGYKVAGHKYERKEEEPIIIPGGKEAKSKNKERGGRAAKTERLQVDFRFSNENSQMETRDSRGGDRGGRGRGGDRGGRGRGGDRGGRGRGGDRGGRGRRGGGRGGNRSGGKSGPKLNEDDFPSL